jgi:hypothetical protein
VVADAVEMYRETIAWREKFGIAKIMKGVGRNALASPHRFTQKPLKKLAADFGDGPPYDERPGRGNCRLLGEGNNSATEWSFVRDPKTPTAELAQVFLATHGPVCFFLPQNTYIS